MDAVLIPFLQLSLYLLSHERYYLGSIVLGAAVGAKLWPVLPGLLLVLRLRRNPRLLLTCTVVLTLTVGAQIEPDPCRWY